MKIGKLKNVALALTMALLGACSVGPDYVRPNAATPVAYKEWKVAEPKDAERRGEWWKVYGDPVLNDLMAQVNVSNQTLKQAEASYREAHALVAAARAAYFPTVALDPSVTRSRRGQNGSENERPGPRGPCGAFCGFYGTDTDRFGFC